MRPGGLIKERTESAAGVESEVWKMFGCVRSGCASASARLSQCAGFGALSGKEVQGNSAVASVLNRGTGAVRPHYLT